MCARDVVDTTSVVRAPIRRAAAPPRERSVSPEPPALFSLRFFLSPLSLPPGEFVRHEGVLYAVQMFANLGGSWIFLRLYTATRGSFTPGGAAARHDLSADAVMFFTAALCGASALLSFATPEADPTTQPLSALPLAARSDEAIVATATATATAASASASASSPSPSSSSPPAEAPAPPSSA